MNEIVNKADKLVSMINSISKVALDNKHEESLCHDISKFIEYTNAVNFQKYINYEINMHEYFVRIKAVFDQVNFQANEAKQALQDLYDITTIKLRDKPINAFPMEEFLKYVNNWRKEGTYIVDRDNSTVDLDELKNFISINSFMDFTSLSDYLQLLRAMHLGFFCYREYPLVKEQFEISFNEINQFKDNLKALYAAKHGVEYDVYIDWVDQVTDPRCRALKADGSPCENIMTVKKPHSPREFRKIEHTCCHIHRKEYLTNSGIG